MRVGVGHTGRSFRRRTRASLQRAISTLFVQTDDRGGDILLIVEDLLPDLIVFTSPQEYSSAPIPRTFDMTLHATKPITLLQGSDYF